MSDVEKVKQIIENESITLVLVREDDVMTSDKRGIAPLVELCDGDKSVSGYCAADKIVGRAAAFLYVLLGVRYVYAEVLSRGGKDVLEGNGIAVEYKTLTDGIINRKGDGPCPMERAVGNIDDPLSALAAVKAKLAELRSPLS